MNRKFGTYLGDMLHTEGAPTRDIYSHERFVSREVPKLRGSSASVLTTMVPLPILASASFLCESRLMRMA